MILKCKKSVEMEDGGPSPFIEGKRYHAWLQEGHEGQMEIRALDETDANHIVWDDHPTEPALFDWFNEHFENRREEVSK